MKPVLRRDFRTKKNRVSKNRNAFAPAPVREEEIGAIRKNWHRHARIALIYPNTYSLGMTNLGVQRLYQVFNEHPAFLCERFFLPEEIFQTPSSPLRSIESGRALQDFDILAFSISFETDYLNVLRILQWAQIPFSHRDRLPKKYPLLLAGGCGVTVNPEPLADFFDLLCIGEGEDFVSPFLEAFLARDRKSLSEFLEHCAGLPGLYVPSFFQFHYEASRIRKIEKVGPGPQRILRLITKDLDPVPTQTVVVPKESPFRNMFLVETGRGCEWACRFCASGYIYRYPRERGIDSLKEAIHRGLELGMRIGLVGSDMSCHPYIGDLMEYILDRGGTPSLSSIRVEAIDDRLAKLLARTGIKTMTLAPDAGSFRLRRVLNKNMPDEMILEAVKRLLSAGIKNIKLYFIIGLPTEDEEDIASLIRLCEDVRKLMLKRAAQTKQMGLLSISLNPFIPKPGTPFQWVGLEPKAVIEKRFRLLRKHLVPQGNVKMDLESYRSCYLQAFLSRGDRRSGPILSHMLKTGKDIDRAAKDLEKDLHYVPQEQIHRQWEVSEILPWDLIDHGFESGYLAREMNRGFQTKLIPNCKPQTCRLCGIC